jgi:hypothetical protein
MSLSVGEQQLETGGAAAAAGASDDIFRAVALAAIDDAQRWASKFFDFAEARISSLFEHLERVSRARSVGELAEIWGTYAQDQFEASTRQKTSRSSSSENILASRRSERRTRM